MELKQSIILIPCPYIELLIVPYGIETNLLYGTIVTSCLLIVPYGIETIPHGLSAGRNGLLIVPYGIETLQQVPRP